MRIKRLKCTCQCTELLSDMWRARLTAPLVTIKQFRVTSKITPSWGNRRFPDNFCLHMLHPERTYDQRGKASILGWTTVRDLWICSRVSFSLMLTELPARPAAWALCWTLPRLVRSLSLELWPIGSIHYWNSISLKVINKISELGNWK